MTNGDYCVPGNAVPTVKITLGTLFPGVPAGNDPWGELTYHMHWGYLQCGQSTSSTIARLQLRVTAV